MSPEQMRLLMLLLSLKALCRWILTDRAGKQVSGWGSTRANEWVCILYCFFLLILHDSSKQMLPSGKCCLSFPIFHGHGEILSYFETGEAQQREGQPETEYPPQQISFDPSKHVNIKWYMWWVRERKRVWMLLCILLSKYMQ